VLAIAGVDETWAYTGIDDYDLIWVLLEHRAAWRSSSAFVLPSGPFRERLTDVGSARDIGRILDKHGVAGAAGAPPCQKARWFGEPVRIAAARISGDGSA
jgi:hypothetical protein